MKDERDLLSHVSRTLRERHDGSEPTTARTRERILASVRKHNKRRSWWIKGSIPGGMLLLGTTAWAQATHQWPAMWRTIGDILSLPLSSEGNSEQELANGRNTASKPRLSASSSPSQAASTADNLANLVGADAGLATETTAGDVAIDVANDTLVPNVANSQDDTSVNVAKVRRKKALAIEPPEPPEPAPTPEAEPAEPPSEPEIAAFRAANDLDIKQRNLGSALSAYRLYVRDYPTGRFVPEARYNAAIILVKLGKRDEARRELTPFASGKYGAHRQARAAKLLEAMERGTAPSADPQR